MTNCYECEFLICLLPSLEEPAGGQEFCAKETKPEPTGECLEFQKRTAPHVTLAEVCPAIPDNAFVEYRPTQAHKVARDQKSLARWSAG